MGRRWNGTTWIVCAYERSQQNSKWFCTSTVMTTTSIGSTSSEQNESFLELLDVGAKSRLKSSERSAGYPNLSHTLRQQDTKAKLILTVIRNLDVKKNAFHREGIRYIAEPRLREIT